MPISSSVPGPTPPPFGRFSGPSMQPTIPAAAAFGLGPGTGLHPTVAFPADAYGVSSIAERPKKVQDCSHWLCHTFIFMECITVFPYMSYP